MKLYGEAALRGAGRSAGKSIASVGLAALLGTSMLTAVPVYAQAPLGAKVSPSQDAPKSFADLAAKLSPAVVDITTTTTVAQADQGSGGEGDGMMLPPGSPFEEFFRDFMDRNGQGQGQGSGPQRPQRSSALGSGFLISDDGYIVTNNHVIEKADEIKIELNDGRYFDAKLVGHDPRTDVALLKIESDKSLPFVKFGDSDKMRVGDWVLAIGNPLGQGFSVSSGIVSARNRTLQGSYDDFIQTDAAINRGNSGGPLFNMDGDVIGMNTAILSPNGGSIGIGFAMASDVVGHVVEQLRDYGEVHRGWLGVRIQNVDPDMAEALGLKQAQGAMVTDVPEGPAQKAGLAAGDVIVKFGDQDVKDTRQLVKVVANTQAGDVVPVVIYRGGKQRTLNVDIGRLDETTMASAPGAPQSAPAEQSEQTVLGMKLSPVTSELKQQFSLADDVQGLVVVGMEDTSDAFGKGIREGDVITKVGQADVTDARQMRKSIKDAEKGGRNSVLLLVSHDGQPRFVALNLSN